LGFNKLQSLTHVLVVFKTSQDSRNTTFSSLPTLLPFLSILHSRFPFPSPSILWDLMSRSSMSWLQSTNMHAQGVIQFVDKAL
jgi:hypothetical protein